MRCHRCGVSLEISERLYRMPDYRKSYFVPVADEVLLLCEDCRTEFSLGGGDGR